MPELPINLSGTPTYKRAAGASPDNLSVANREYNPLNDTSLNYVTPKKSGYDASSTTIAEAAADRTGRYKTVMYGYDNEEAAAQRQSLLDKGANGILKGVNLTATTIAGGFGMLYGAAKAPFTGRLADIWDNGIMRGLDEWNKEVDDKILPNYYTKAERDSAWYSPDNWMTANFLFDKLIKNSGYAVGAMVSGNIANAGLLRAGAALGRVASAGAVAAESSQAFKIFSPLLRNTSRAFSAGKNIEAAEILRKELSSIADVTATSSKLAQIEKATGAFAEFGSSARRTAIAAYSSAGEASFEALQTGNQFRDSLIQEYVDKYGEQPAGDVLEEINKRADQVGKTSFFGNLALLSATEYVQLPYLLGSSYKNTRQAAGVFAGKVDDVLAKTPDTKLGKIYEKATSVGRYVFDPKEAGQEVGQFALQVGTQNYFSKAAESEDADVWVDGFLYGLVGRDEEGKGEGALVSKEGMESFLLGGLTGGPLQARAKAQEKRAKTENTERFLNQIDRAPSFKQAFQDRMSSVNRGVVLQQQHEAAIITGNELEARDLRTDMMHNYLAPRIKYGRFDMVIDDVNELRQMSSSETGLAELKAQGIANVNDTVDSFQKRLNNYERVAKNTNDIYNGLYIRYSGERLEDGNPKYSPYVLDKMAYASSKIADYDLRIPQLNNLLTDKGIIVGNLLDEVLKGKRPSRQATAEILNNINDLSTTSDVKDGLKTALQDIVSLGERRKTFMEEYEDIKDNPLNYETDPEFNVGDKVELPVSVGEPEKKIEIGKEYSLDKSMIKEGSALYMAPKLTVLSQTLGGELEVKMPGGKIKFIAPEDLKGYNLLEEDNTSKELADIMDESIDAVLKKEEYKDLPEMKDGDSKLGYINSLADQALTDDVEAEFNRRTEDLVKRKEEERRQQEELIKNRAALEKQQTELEAKSGTIATPPPPTPEELQALAATQGKLKSAFKLFISGTTPTERADEPVHIRNSREFLNNAKNFKNKGDLAAILVTPNQEAALGLSGLTALSYGTSDASDATNVETGLVAQVFVEQEDGKTYFVNKNGERIGEIGKPVDVQQVVFQTMPTPSLYDRSGKPRFRADEMADAEVASKGWAAKRVEVFESPAFPVKAYRFSISRGVPILNVVDGKYERNQIGDILIPENKIATQEGLLQVVTQGSVVHNGENIKFNNGLTVLQYGDTLQIINNNRLGDKKANAVYLAIKNMMDEFQQTKKLNPNLTAYIQNVLFWRKTGTTYGNQIFINTSTGEVSLGGKNYTPADLVNKKDEIVTMLKEAFHSINNSTLRDRFYESFYEYKVENDQLVEQEWPNYQSYLLSKKGRSADQTPLVTSVAKPTEAIPYSYKQKYATLIDFELPMIQAPAPAAATKEAVAEGKVTLGNFIMDGETKNTFTGFKTGPIDFTGTIDDKGDISVSVLVNDTITDAAKNGKLVNETVVPALKEANQFDPSADDIELVTTFVANKLAIELKALQPAAPAVEPEAPAPPAPPTTETYNPEGTGAPQDDYMRVGEREAGVETLDDAQIELFKIWAAEKVPTIPYEVLDNLVNTYDNEKAWGVFENNVAKFYKGAPGTTPYHEVFEGIWKGFLTPEQRQLILDEFKAKAGQFTDRASGKKINYADATDQQAKERIADDFGAFRVGRLPARSVGERVLRFFRDIINFFKSFVQKPSMKEELFKAIEAGKFKDAVLSASIAASTPEYMRIPGLTETQAYEFVQDMTARVANYIFGDSKKSLYDIKKITGKEIFNKIKEAYASDAERKYQKLGEERFNQLVTRTKEKLRTLGINFNDEDTVDINDENVSSRDYAPEPFSTDWKKTSPFPVKLVAATLPEVKPTNQQTASSLKLPERQTSGVMGLKLASFGKVFNTLLDKVSNTTSVKLVKNKLVDLAKSDGTFVRFFQRIGGDLSDMDFKLSSREDWRLFINFYQTFTKQKPNADIQYFDGNSVYTAPANQFTASKLLQSEWFENMKALADDPASIIKKNKQKQTFEVDKSKLPGAVPKEPQTMVNFLADLGVSFPLSAYTSLKTTQKDEFGKAVGGIYTYIQKNTEVGTITGKTLGINPQLSDLANLYIKTTNPSQDTTYFGVENQRIQSYAENNVPSIMENEFNSVKTVEELKELRPELNDVFSTNSITLKDGGNFYNLEGQRYKKIKVGYIQGRKTIDTDAGITTSKLTLGDRFTQEINENLNGDYYILVPADGSTEWKINLGNHMSFVDIAGGRAWSKIYSIFKGYLQDEVALALDYESREKIKNVGDRAKQLRFFREILKEKNVNDIEKMVANGSTQDQINEYIDKNIDDINSAVADFINTTVEETTNLLVDNNQISLVKEDQYSYPGLQDKFATASDINKFKMSGQDIKNLLTFVNANYVINNIELHKFIFGDPYEFAVKKGKLDETKRIKSFLSPRRITFDSPEYNSFLNDDYNTASGVTLTPNDPGYHLHKSYTNTVTLADINLSSELYPNINEADAASFIMDTTYREVKLKNGQWIDEVSEPWHQWQMAYTRNKLAAKGEYTYTSDRLQKADSELISKPEPKFVTEVLKPIVSGVKATETKIDNVLDKFSQMPLYYKNIEGTNLEKLYIKMWKENIGYAVFESGRKVGATELYNLYSEGTINKKPFTGIVKVPWKAYGIQVENAYEDPKDQTRGSQLTKLSSLDLFSDGKGTDQAKKAYERNLKALNALHEDGYKTLLDKLGLEDLGDGFRLIDPKAVQETLEYEMLRREMAENAKDTIKRDENGQFPIPFEASPAYKQIKDILFSMVNKSLVSPKMNGAPKVQVPVTGWEKQNRKSGKPNPELKFYTKEDPYMEVLLPHWFRGKFNKKKFPNDEAILRYLNTSPEGKSILKGIGFRIPTQSMSSIEVFRVKGFLPQSMGDTIVVPSEVTAKAGSDFDIDKMNTYLRSTYIDKSGDIKLVKYQGSEEATKEFFGKVFDNALEKEKVNKADLLEAAQILSLGLEDPNDLLDRYSNLLDVLLENVKDSSEFENEIVKELERLGDVNLQAKLKNRFMNDMYRRSLENEYYQALEDMLTLPENFDRLIAPVDDAGLSDLATELDVLRKEDETTIPGRLLNRNYMTPLRNAFVTAKKWVGISAVNITGQSLTQKSEVYIDPARFEALSDFDKKILGDGKIALPHNKVTIDGKDYISISGKMTEDGKQYISDRLSGYATSFVDVAKDPYIMKIIGSNSVVGTFMFLERIGVGENTIWFLNQPIIKEYLSYLDSIGKKGLFGKKDGEYIRSLFATSIKDATFDPSTLKENISKYYDNQFNDEDNAAQQAIFTEFLKYAKMAEYSFKLTQASNYDTTKFRSGDEFSRKQTRTTTARDKNIFSSVDKILNSSFIGNQAKFIDSAMSSLGEIIKTEKDDFTIITNDVIKPFLENEFLGAEDFNRIAAKAKTSFIDYIIQTQSPLNTEIEALVVANTSVADQLAQAKKRHPEMKILNELQVVSSDRIGGAKSVRLRANLKDAFDTDMYTDMMRELKLVEPDLYNGLVKLSLLQGTYQTAISIRNIIPIEDLSPMIKPVIDSLSSTEEIKNFSKGAFYRNNWKDNTIVPTVQPKFFAASEMPIGEDPSGNEVYQYYSPLFPNIEYFDVQSIDRKVLLLSEIYNSSDVKYDFVKIPRVVTDKKTGEMIDMENGQTVTRAMFARQKAQGDLSLKDVFGYQKVKYSNGEPLVTAKGEHVYKLVNLYGDGQLASEYYLESKPSVLNNGTVQVDNEIPDANLIKFFGVEEVVVPSQPDVTIAEKINIYAGTGENADLSNFAIRPFVISGDKYQSVEQYFQYQKWNYLREDIDQDVFNRNAKIADAIMRTTDGGMLKSFGKKFLALDTKSWDENASKEMKMALKTSFEQNPQALRRLLSTGKAELTHTQDTTKWGKEFPKLLMEVRSELANSKTLESLGFSPEEIGNILKSIC
jgi:predicted NAD-dependent protein-ADP-ribosyltransferase YbiA (DUF1768 family)